MVARLVSTKASRRARNRAQLSHGDVCKPSVVQGYAASLRLRLLPALGGRKLGDVSRRDVQRVVDSWLEEGVDAEHDPATGSCLSESSTAALCKMA
ncbi:MAG: N-terminal phage integrase SAM-like domain-containing protein [Actinomycetota bacterium]|nr:N-terminal phage integrase SAM-like domain-containing protein [Actinomycetota bacterium]